MKKFVISNGIIENIIEADDSFSIPGKQLVPVGSTRADIGWEWVNNAPVEPIEPDPIITNEQVTTERDRRVDNGFMFGGKLYQFDPASKARVTGAATLAKFAILGGAQVGNYRWMNPNLDFTWTAADNSSTLMDAQTCSAFGDTAAIHEQLHFLAGKALKAMSPIPSDYTDDKYWPTVG